MRKYIHDYERGLEREMNNVKEVDFLTEKNKKLILDFYEYNFRNDVSTPRLLKQLNYLKLTAKLTGKEFDKATAEDYGALVSHLKKLDRAPDTIDTYKSILKVFHKWLSGGKDYPDCVSWMKFKNRASQKLPEDLLTQEDAKKLIHNTLGKRDKALVSVLWESGARIGELGGLKIKHAVFDNYGGQIIVSGKTGMRRIRLINSAPYLLEWINSHPYNSNREMYVFINLEVNRGEMMGHKYILKMLQAVKRRAKIQKPINPHHFRHSRATYMSQFLTEAQMKEYFGWVQDSKMAARYVHLSGKQVDDAILRMHGLKKEDKKEDILKRQECPRCKNLNEVNVQICEKCWLPLNQQVAVEQVETQKKDQEGIILINKLLELAKENPEKLRQVVALARSG